MYPSSGDYNVGNLVLRKPPNASCGYQISVQHNAVDRCFGREALF